MSGKDNAIDPLKATQARELLTKIVEGATRSDSNLSEVLRLCMQLGAILKNEPLSLWARKEASGYDKSNSEELPEYRVFDTQVHGDFLGPFGSGIKNAHIPQSVIDEQHRDALFMANIYDSVGELVRLISRDSKSEILKLPWSADAIAYYQHKEIYENMALASAWRVMSKNTLAGILEQIRTRTLDFALKIDSELSAVQVSSEQESKLEPDKVTQIFYTTVTGGNVAFSGTGDVSQSISAVSEGDIESLKKVLREIGVLKEDIKELEIAIKNDSRPKGEFGPKVATWIGKVLTKGLKGTFQVAQGAAGGLITQALAKYYGIG